jgi:ankyrin repeat protein
MRMESTDYRRDDANRIREVFSPNNVRDADARGFVALHLAAYFDSVQCVTALLQMGAHVDVRASNGRTPLHYACAKGSLKVASLLLRMGAVVDLADYDGITPLWLAICNDRHLVARLVISCGANVNNVKLNRAVPAIPDWIQRMVAAKSCCRTVAIILIGIHKHRYTDVTGPNDINVIRYIAKFVWASRGDEVWEEVIPKSTGKRCMIQ